MSKPIIISMEVTDEPEGIVIILQESRREDGKISVWVRDYKFGDLTIEEVTKFVTEYLLKILKQAGYERKRLPKIGDRVVFKHDTMGVNAGTEGVIVDIETDRPYPYLIKILDSDAEVFARLGDFDIKDRSD